jgi:hypothetical protein
MKNFAFIISLSLITFLFAQTPQVMIYEAVLRNENGQILANRQIEMKISIIRTEVSKTVVYSETHTLTTDDKGLISIKIGNGTSVVGAFSGIEWSKGSYFIQAETELNGGNNYLFSELVSL